MRRILIASGMALFCASAAAAQQGTPPSHDPKVAFAQTDKNGDGEIDHAEFQNRMTEVFYFADRDKDGLAVEGELQVYDEEKLFDRADKNGDGKLSLKEFVAARFEHYDEVDTDGSGTLSLDEVVAEFER
jgi:Ca2+-binding EF-hand superfamily protein